MSNQITEQKILEALGKVMDPELNKDLVSLGMIKDISVEEAAVKFTLELTTAACPLRNKIQEDARQAVLALEGVKGVDINVTARVRPAMTPREQVMPGVKNIIAVASGKGGVGKSTVAANLACALAKEGASVGLLDADIYGPSIPLMMGINEHPQSLDGVRVLPLDHHGVKLMSIGFFLKEEDAVIWRGPMVMKMLNQFLGQVVWGELDYMIVDLPPGTGDAQLTLVQTVPVTGAVIVTTPQDVALIDAKKSVTMFERVNVKILGIIENMSYFLCPHCQGRSEIFSHGGGQKESERLGVPFLGEIPIELGIREAGDRGLPIVLAQPDSLSAKQFTGVAQRLAAQISIMNYAAQSK
jgi:ATP-binding protein involved in chromosome partitioning